MLLTRRYRFSASHRLDTPAMSAEENRKLYGKCNNPFGHGHDYVLDVTLSGPVEASGQMVPRAALDTLVTDRVLSRLDHRNLNQELPGAVATTENLAFAIRDLLTRDWPLQARLHKVRISETDRNIFELKVGS